MTKLEKLNLSTVTLCAATSVNVVATIAALRACCAQVDFADCVLLTDAELTTEADGLRIVAIQKLHSALDYSEFMLTRLADHVQTTHCLVVQWDGFILDAGCWDASFLDFDYIGAPWPQFDDDRNVGNGGFSLRSRKLLEACKDVDFQLGHPEDVAICRVNRALLETCHGLRFADPATARRFSFERSVTGRSTFGFHGVFNMIPTLGIEPFWRIYCALDDPRTAFTDFWMLIRQIGIGRFALSRRARLMRDRLADLFSR